MIYAVEATKLVIGRIVRRKRHRRKSFSTTKLFAKQSSYCLQSQVAAANAINFTFAPRTHSLTLNHFQRCGAKAMPENSFKAASITDLEKSFCCFPTTKKTAFWTEYPFQPEKKIVYYIFSESFFASLFFPSPTAVFPICRLSNHDNLLGGPISTLVATRGNGGKLRMEAFGSSNEKQLPRTSLIISACDFGPGPGKIGGIRSAGFSPP